MKKKLRKKERKLLEDIWVEATILTSMFPKKSKKKRKQTIKLLKLPGYGRNILRHIKRIDRLTVKVCLVKDLISGGAK